MTIKSAIIIGNGGSRSSVDLNQLLPGTVKFGCNALYRDFYPDYLVAIDDEIIAEIKKSDFPKERFIVPPRNEQYEPAECNPSRPRSNAGMNAMLEAIKMGYNNLVCIGFDFLLETEEYALSNVYDDTSCYDEKTRASINDTRARINYLAYVVKTNPDVEFAFFYPEDIDSRIFSLNLENFRVMSF